MNILLIGSGGREHALAWKMAKSHHCDQLFIAPGNPGTASIGKNLPISATDFEGLQKAALEHQIGMIVVGPEDPLVKGIYDFFAHHPATQHINVIGPSAQAAQLEGSKAFSKHFMQRHQIPTASYAEFTADNYEEGVAYIRQHSLPIVLKADGLAAGKGVIIATSTQEALQSFEEMIVQKQFGEASSKVVIEQFLTGIEVSVFALTDGKNYQIIGHAKDYKRIGEGDQGLNTGGMGCVTPVPFMDEAFMEKVEKTIVRPTIEGIAKEGLVYKGFVFFGLMNQDGTPYVIEYNCRLGDPETEVILPRLQTDLVSLLAAADNGTLEDVNIEYQTASFATVMTVSGGYPGDYQKGYTITGIEEAQSLPNTLVFQAGTGFKENQIITQGGRVITVTASGDDLQSAVSKAQKGCEIIQFTNKYFRKDIGYEFA
ncbi:MAG: phosphoribosylamine--glycine ligase [Chitinophagia bacterium]|jgi:phosphoribosylamine--glycine ligase|nr:phosphoribosylamine--glycine ligase [Chitinophagia bacterium]